MREDAAPIDAALLDRFMAGECTPQEEAEVRAWLGARPERGRLLNALRAAPIADPAATREAWSRLSARLELGEPGVVPIGRRRGAAAGLRAAAVVLLLLGGATVWREWGPPASAPAAAIAAERATGVGERATVRLADGTRVTLAPASRLRVRDDFGRGAREVELEGEGVFSVSHDPTRPFRVVTGDATTEVLGTEFAVQAAATETGVRVVVASGRVALRSREDAKGVLLRAGDLGRVGAGGVVTAEHDVDVARYLAWSTGRLVFEDAPLTQVAIELERWYPVKLAIPDRSLARRRLTATYTVGQPIDEVLASVALAMNARVRQRGAALELVPLP